MKINFTKSMNFCHSRIKHTLTLIRISVRGCVELPVSKGLSVGYIQNLCTPFIKL